MSVIMGFSQMEARGGGEVTAAAAVKGWAETAEALGTGQLLRALALVGFPIRQQSLHFWQKTGLVRPSVHEAHGKGDFNKWSVRDVAALWTILSLRRQGVSLQKIRRALAALRQRFPAHEIPADAVLVAWAGDVLLCSRGELAERLVSVPGQLVLLQLDSLQDAVTKARAG